MNSSRDSSQAGLSIIELLVVMSLLSILTGLGALQLKEFFQTTEVAAEQVSAHFKLIRSKAISTTKAYLYAPTDSDTIAVSTRDTCVSSDPWVVDSSSVLNLENGASFTDTSWSVCINSVSYTHLTLPTIYSV